MQLVGGSLDQEHPICNSTGHLYRNMIEGGGKMLWECWKDRCGLAKRRITIFGSAYFLLLTIFATASFAGIDTTVFGPKRYDRSKGAPNLYLDTFELCNPSGLALLRVTNGNGKDTAITSGRISINGKVVVSENEFKQQTYLIEKPISVTQMNKLTVELKSSNRETSFVTVEILGAKCDSTAPVIFAPSPVDGALLKISRPTIGANFQDETNGSGIDLASASLSVDGADVTAKATVSANGISYLPAANLPNGEHTVTLTVADRASNRTYLVWHFTTNTIAPTLNITSPRNGQ
jgi:hypothetical protein